VNGSFGDRDSDIAVLAGGVAATAPPSHNLRFYTDGQPD
jgi:hypothetical protein